MHMDEIGRRQVLEEGRQLAVERESPDAAFALVEVREQERAVRQDGEAVRLDQSVALDQRLPAVSMDARHAATPVGDEHVALRRAVHALRAIQVRAEGLDVHESAIRRPSALER